VLPSPGENNGATTITNFAFLIKQRSILVSSQCVNSYQNALSLFNDENVIIEGLSGTVSKIIVVFFALSRTKVKLWSLQIERRPIPSLMVRYIKWTVEVDALQYDLNRKKRWRTAKMDPLFPDPNRFARFWVCRISYFLHFRDYFAIQSRLASLIRSPYLWSSTRWWCVPLSRGSNTNRETPSSRTPVRLAFSHERQTLDVDTRIEILIVEQCPPPRCRGTKASYCATILRFFPYLWSTQMGRKEKSFFQIFIVGNPPLYLGYQLLLWTFSTC